MVPDMSIAHNAQILLDACQSVGLVEWSIALALALENTLVLSGACLRKDTMPYAQQRPPVKGERLVWTALPSNARCNLHVQSTVASHMFTGPLYASHSNEKVTKL